MNVDAATVLIVDDEPSVRRALTRLLTSAGLRVESFASGVELLDRLPVEGVGCILLDLRMPGGSGLQVQEQLAAADCLLPVIFLTGHGDVPASVHAMKEGAMDFLQKPVTDTQLLKAIEGAVARCQQRLAEQAKLNEIRTRHARLTGREKEVFAGVVAGKLNKQIAAELGTVEKTIKVHRSRVMRKMQAQSVADLVRMSTRL